MSRPTAVLLIAHSAQLAAGAAEVAAQMAPDVLVRAAGGTEDGRIGTSYDLVDQALSGLLDDGAEEIVLLTDLGSATLTAESVLEMREDDRLRLADGPFVEGAVAAAVAAQGGAKAGGVAGAAEHAADSFAGQEAPGQRDAGEQSEDTSQVAAGPALGADVVTRSLELRNSLGLHARPAAQLARKMDGFDATVRINGVDATSVLALMGLGLTGGARLQVEASGPEATDALDVLEADVEAGFGEE
ncbi:MAG TPA: dihydroxyacetone kinase phosphoryl donor subunit DhaM [Ruania sp.]|nr:dihydroxyacetone kinase phosphoryl donor subunit DhaM [Ruania sp.]